MKQIMIFILCCLIGVNAYAEYDVSLIHEIKSWRKGDVPPARLLKFPNGRIDIPPCGMRTLGSTVEDYVAEIQNTDLLIALIFNPLSQANTFHAAVSRLITLKGVQYVSLLLRDRRKEDPNAFLRSELAALLQLLQSPYVSIQVARISPEDMPPDKAEPMLQQMKQKLNDGMVWADAYRMLSEMYPDLRERAKEPKSVRTLICYLYDSTVSPVGFDIITNSTAVDLPLEHLRELFRVQRGTHVIRGTNGVYLYHITNYYAGAL